MSVYYGLYKKIWSHFISWYHMDFSRAWCPFGYCFCFRSCSAASLPLCSFLLPLWPFSVTCYHLCRLQKADVYWQMREKETLALYCLLHVCSLWFYTWICSLASGSWKCLGYLFGVANEWQEAFCSGGVKKSYWGRQKCFLLLIPTAHGTEEEAQGIHRIQDWVFRVICSIQALFWICWITQELWPQEGPEW